MTSSPDAATPGALVRDLYLLMRTVLTHGALHPLSERAALTLRQSLIAARPPLDLQFVGQAIFRDRNLVPLDMEDFLKSQDVATALSGLGAQELSFDEVPAAPVLMRLGNALARGSQGIFEAREQILPGIGWRELPGAFWGREAEEVDPDVFSAAYLALAVAKAEGIIIERAKGWNWSAGMSIVRRLEKAIAVDGPAFARALEIAPGEWSPARRAVAVAYRYLSVAHALEASTSGARAGAHAALAVACLGLEATGGVRTVEAARAALTRMTEGPGARAANVPPHRVRVSALLHALCDQRSGAAGWRGVLGLVHLVYELERRRMPGSVPFSFTFADLLAQAAAEMGTSFDESCVRALVYAVGEIPPGANVRLDDGTVGIVLEKSEVGDPLRPKVLVGTQIVVPERPVALISPTKTHRPARSRLGA